MKLNRESVNIATMPSKEAIIRGEVLLWGAHDYFLVMQENAPMRGLCKLIEGSLHSKSAVNDIYAMKDGDLDVQLALSRLAEDETLNRGEVMYETTMERMIVFFTLYRHQDDCMEWLEQSYRSNLVLSGMYGQILATAIEPELDHYNMAIRFRLGRLKSNLEFLKIYVNVAKIHGGE